MPLEELLAYKKECLAELENLSLAGLIDLFYADESQVSTEGYVPYGWQLPGEQVFVPSEKGAKINCFALVSRQCQCYWRTTEQIIDAPFVFEQLENLAFSIQKHTVVVLDNAPVHTAKIIRQRIPCWQQKGLFVFFLPPYSPHLNIAETLWRHLKKFWIAPEDYIEKDNLFFAVNRALAAVGTLLSVDFSPFNAI